METNYRVNCEDYGNHKHAYLGEFEWGFGLCRGHCMQGRHFFKQLHYQHEQIEIKTDHGADRIDPAPRSCEMLGVTRVNRQREKRQRYDSETDCRREPVKRKKESSDSCEDCCCQKPLCTAVESLVRNHSKHNNDAGKNRRQANQHVNNRVNVENHLSPFSSATT